MKELLLGLFYLQLRLALYLIVLFPVISWAQIITINNKDQSPIEGVSVHTENNNFISVSDKNGKISEH